MFAGGGEEGDLHQYKRAGRDARRIPQRDFRGRLWEIQVKKSLDFCEVLWLRINFNACPGPTFYLSADLDLGNQIHADPDLDHGQTLKSQKVKFYIKNIL
jgi:hypothetical protein